MPTHGTDSLFQLKFTAKQLNKQSRKAAKDEAAEKEKCKKALMKNDSDSARIYADNAIRKKNESLNLLRLASRVDTACSRVQTAVTMRKVTNNMTSVVRQMDKAMESMNLERISMVMEKFEGQFEDLDVQTNYMESALGESAAVATPQDQVDGLLQQVADEAGIEREQAVAQEARLPELKEAAKEPVEEDLLANRLRALRQAA